MYSKKILIVLITAASIAGCSSDTPTPAVVLNSATQTALYLPVLADQWIGGVVQLATKEKNGCSRLAANILPDPVDDDYIVEIDGNRDIFFHMARADAQAECNILGMFYAIKGNEYLVKFEIKNKQCLFSLIETTQNGAQNKIRIFPAYVSMLDAAKVCENKDKLYY